MAEAIQRVTDFRVSDVAPVRFSSLKRIAMSPAHYEHFRRNPPPQTKALRIGACLDDLVAAPDPDDAFIVATCATQLKSQGKKAQGPSETDIVLGMLDALQRHQDAWQLLRDGVQRKQMAWTMAGRGCRGTPDTYTGERLVDLKSTRSSHPDRFQTDGRWRGYHAQLAWYGTGLRAAGLAEPRENILVTVENAPPFPVTVFELTPAALLAGEKLWRSWWERLMVCEASGVFPGYVESRVPFDVPDDGGLSLIIDGEETEVE